MCSGKGAPEGTDGKNYVKVKVNGTRSRRKSEY